MPDDRVRREPGGDALGLVPEKWRIETVGLALVEVTEELIESLSIRDRFRLSTQPKSPFAEKSRAVARFLEDLGYGDIVLVQSFAVALVGITAHARVTRMKPLHETRSRRRADRVSGVGIAEAHSFARDPIDVRSLNLFLTVTTQITPTQVIGQDEDDVRLMVGLGNADTEEQQREVFHTMRCVRLRAGEGKPIAVDLRSCTGLSTS